ncbi:nicotinate-nucleotide adenylyltransferase [Segniliparus rugosus]|uniref:Probable nicotinate-nucleotide adenylyltransferase n=1 Tax=Segniliparus rugosus (strain ATCC BAA-974 / DSM 45345 / CCUG 50838 / CIP 108380 / JCM 13579 / CDC 945) TaxID=679197 RepID=E5XMI9_SEGRC|nr:nicotinate-nucleotide adenylyltransferase [Segniliparus rugosus]EFV14433.1 nicotinate (nicotinamide) nucleotide adenylyltransferase [Segniliparus rugosus ATCC BAA-974]
MPSKSEPNRALRLGVMGGTFDPIHHGHLVAASEVANLFGFDEVLFVPSGRPWQKTTGSSFPSESGGREVTEAEHRYLMAVIATAANPRFSVSRVDIDRPGDTYTIDTLRDLRRRHPQAELFFITGADALANILTWQRWEELFELAKFVGVSRPGYELSLDAFGDRLAQLPEGSVTLVEVPALAISSTDCRQRARDGRPIWYLVPDGVVQYIGKHQLYRARESKDKK